MKKLVRSLAVAAVLVSGFTFNSSAQVDVAVTEVQYYNPTNQEYMTNNAGPVSIVWENIGDPLAAGDTIFFAIQINGATLRIPGFLAPTGGYTTGAVDTFNYHATTALPPQQFFQRLDDLSLLGGEGTLIGGTPIGDNRQITVISDIRVAGGTGVNADVNPLNDTLRTDFTLVDGDFSVSNLVVLDGDNDVNDEIVSGGSIDTIGFFLGNESSLPFYHYFTEVEVSVDGALDTVQLVIPRGQTAYGAWTGSIDANDTIGALIGLDPTLTPTATGDFDICVRTLYDADATDTTNDQTCRTFTVIADTNATGGADLAFTSLVISNPNIPAGGTYGIGDAVTELTLTVTNSGTADFNGAINADITIGSSTTSISETPSAPIAVGASYTITITGNDIPTFPGTPTNFDICAQLNVTDADASNNQGCTTYEADWRAGITTLNGIEVNAFYSNGDIVLKTSNTTNEVVNVSVYSVTGSEVLNTKVSLTNQVNIPFNNVENGVYILKFGEEAIRFVK